MWDQMEESRDKEVVNLLILRLDYSAVLRAGRPNDQSKRCCDIKVTQGEDVS